MEPSSTATEENQAVSEAPTEVKEDPLSKEFKLYTRCVECKQFFVPQSTATTTDPSTLASYFVHNPIPRKHAAVWRPHLYAGDNPKYDTSSTVIGRARRNWAWSSFAMELGEGVAQEVANKKVRIETKKRKRVAWWRRLFRMKEKVYAEGPGQEMEITGRIVRFTMERGAWGKGKGGWRDLSWEFEGVRYCWRGTRERGTGKGPGKVKGIGHGIKLVRLSDEATMATFSKSYFAAFGKTEKLGGPPNKKRVRLGSLRLLSAALERSPSVQQVAEEVEVHMEFTPEKFLEAAITFTAWVAVEAEHRLRHSLLDILEEIAEAAGEG